MYTSTIWLNQFYKCKQVKFDEINELRLENERCRFVNAIQENNMNIPLNHYSWTM